MKNSKGNQAEVCFKDLCIKFYNENAEVINGLAVVVASVSVIAALIKSLRL